MSRRIDPLVIRSVARALRQTGADLSDLIAGIRSTAPNVLADVTACLWWWETVARDAGRALADGLRVGDAVFIGSPGAGVDSVSNLPAGVRVWTGRAPEDHIRFARSIKCIEMTPICIHRPTGSTSERTPPTHRSARSASGGKPTPHRGSLVLPRGRFSVAKEPGVDRHRAAV